MHTYFIPSHVLAEVIYILSFNIITTSLFAALKQKNLFHYNFDYTFFTINFDYIDFFNFD